MTGARVCYDFAVRRHRRSLFLGVTTQHLRSGALLAREFARAAAALAAIAAWGALLALLAA